MARGDELVPEVITLYHGTIYAFDTIDVSRGKPFKDFGPGFYASRSLSHAENMAKRNSDLETARRERRHLDGAVEAYVYTFEFDMDKLKNFNCKEFKTADRDWMRFVVQNRTTSDGWKYRTICLTRFCICRQ